MFYRELQLLFKFLLITIFSTISLSDAFSQSQSNKVNVIPYAIPPIFERVNSFSEGMAAVKINHKWGFIDKTGKVVVEPQFNLWQAEFNSSFSDGLVAINFSNGKDEKSNNDSNNVGDIKWGFADKKGKIVIPPKFIGDYFYPPRFSEGLSSIKSAYGFDKKYGYIDKSGEYVIQPTYDKAYDFKDGLAIVEIDGKEGFINAKGDVVIPLIYDTVSFFSDGYSVVMLNGKTTFIDKFGNNPTNKYFDSLDSFSEGLARFLENDKYGFIDKKGNVVIKPFIERGGSLLSLIPGIGFSDGLCVVEFGSDKNNVGKFGYIDKSGNVAINPKFDSVNDFIKGKAIVEMDDKYFFIDKKGNRISQKFNDLEYEADGMVKVNVGDLLNPKYGFIKY